MEVDANLYPSRVNIIPNRDCQFFSRLQSSGPSGDNDYWNNAVRNNVNINKVKRKGNKKCSDGLRRAVTLSRTESYVFDHRMLNIRFNMPETFINMIKSS